jgi:hypothetical protein
MARQVRVNESQISFDEFAWTLNAPVYSSPGKAHLDLGRMLDGCDACEFRPTLNDERQEECRSCPLRLQMQYHLKIC